MENMDKDFLELAANRYSVRKFIDKPVGQEDLDKILKAGYLAPTACNRQPQRILVINRPSRHQTGLHLKTFCS